MRWLPTLTGDLENGEVNVIEGAIHKRKSGDQSPDAGLSFRYYLEVDGRSFEVPTPGVWESVPPVGFFRLYYLPHSHAVVNLEQLPDPPVEASRQDVIGAVTGALTSVFRPGLRRRDRAKNAETFAHADAVLQEAMGTSDQPKTQSAIDPDQGTLSAKVIGSWTSMFFNVDVRADGTLSLQNAQGVRQDGRYRLDPDGQLHVTFDGDTDELVTKISVTGDQLNLDLGGQAMTLNRAP
jgi:hypothetical protein